MDTDPSTYDGYRFETSQPGDYFTFLLPFYSYAEGDFYYGAGPDHGVVITYMDGKIVGIGDNSDVFHRRMKAEFQGYDPGFHMMQVVHTGKPGRFTDAKYRRNSNPASPDYFEPPTPEQVFKWQYHTQVVAMTGSDDPYHNGWGIEEPAPLLPDGVTPNPQYVLHEQIAQRQRVMFHTIWDLVQRNPKRENTASLT